MAVSAIEKKPAATISATSAIASVSKENSSTVGSRSATSIRAPRSGVNYDQLPMQQHLEHELAAEIAQHEQQRSGENPVDCHPPAPAVTPAAEQQNREHDPAGDRENVLVREGHRLAEQLLGKQDSACERQRE